MSAFSDDALRKVLSEIESRARVSQQELEQVSQLTANRLREKRLLDLTGSEISELPGEAHMYRGVGKMFVLTEKSAVLEEIAAEKATTDKALEGLSKRREYLETTLNNARSHIDAATQRAS